MLLLRQTDRQTNYLKYVMGHVEYYVKCLNQDKHQNMVWLTSTLSAPWSGMEGIQGNVMKQTGRDKEKFVSLVTVASSTIYTILWTTRYTQVYSLSLTVMIFF